MFTERENHFQPSGETETVLPRLPIHDQYNKGNLRINLTFPRIEHYPY